MSLGVCFSGSVSFLGLRVYTGGKHITRLFGSATFRCRLLPAVSSRLFQSTQHQGRISASIFKLPSDCSPNCHAANGSRRQLVSFDYSKDVNMQPSQTDSFVYFALAWGTDKERERKIIKGLNKRSNKIKSEEKDKER